MEGKSHQVPLANNIDCGRDIQERLGKQDSFANDLDLADALEDKQLTRSITGLPDGDWLFQPAKAFLQHH